MAKQHFKIGNEANSGRPAVLDLRRVNVRSVTVPAGQLLQRAAKPPVRITANPVRVAKVPKESYLDSFAYDLLFIAIAGFIATATDWRDWLFLAYLLVAIVFRASSQRVFRSALVCLVAIPILSQLHKQDLADMFAVFTFYFLSIGVLRGIMELPRAADKTV